jgi:hypothetical protein
MATAEQLIVELRNNSHTYGWGAVAVFDSAVVMPMLADYYAPMIHGPKGVEAISDVIQPFGEPNFSCALNKLVLGAPRLSLLGDLQTSKLKLTYELRSGSYYERRSAAGGGSDKIDQFLNIEASRTYSLTYEINLETCTGTIDKDGVVRLQLSAGHSPTCNLGSTKIIQDKIGEYLLGVINGRLGVIGIYLGSVKTDRAHLMPKAFRLLVHAKRGSEVEGSALVMFIVGPDGVPGVFPAASELPYLIPDDLTGSQKTYSATVLVDQAYSALAAQVTEFIGQLLFPNEHAFQAVERPSSTRDVVLFGRLQPIPGQKHLGKKHRRAEPGVTSLLLTRSAGDQTPIGLLASTTSIEGWEWELPSPALGELRVNGVEATYVPPASLPPDTKVVLQRIITSNRITRARYEVSLVLTAGDEVKAFGTPILTGVQPTGPELLELVYSSPLPFKTTLSVLGLGTVEDSRYYAPTTYESDIEIVIAKFDLEYQGQLFPVAEGYCIVQLAAPSEEPGWTSLSTFTLEAVAVNARPFANGLQQFAIKVVVETDGNQPEVSDAELASLRLVKLRGAEVERIPHTLERFVAGADGTVSEWGWTDDNNDFDFATLSGALAPKATERAAGRERILYLQTTAGLPREFVARFTNRNGIDYTTNQEGGGEVGKQTLTVTPRPVPAPTSDHYTLTIRRAHGEWGDPTGNPNWTVTDPNYDWNPITTDYWNLVYKFENYAVPFVRLLWDKDGPSAMWETEQNEEEAFSFIGYMMVEEPVPNPAYLQFSSKLYGPMLELVDPVTQMLPDELLKPSWQGPNGSLLFSLHRVLDVFWWRRDLVSGFDLEDPFTFTAWDKNGNQHKLTVGFTDGRDKLFIN